MTSPQNASISTSPFRTALQRLALPAFGVKEAPGPLVIAVEGPNGSGKSTLCAALAERLKVFSCFGTEEAWVSEPFKTRMIRDAEWHASAMFFLSGCFERMRTLCQRQEACALMDRSLWSTLAVHAAEDPDRLAAVLAMLGAVAGEVRVPDFTLVLEASFATCQERISRKSGAARALDELTATAAFHGREQEFYRWLGDQAPNFAFLNAEDGRPEAIRDAAVALLQARVKC